MIILLACEESQKVCNAFRALGHDAYSCDILDCSGGHPEWHIKDDAILTADGWVKVINSYECLFEDWDEDHECAICPICLTEYSECYHPGPTMDYEYKEFGGIMYAKCFQWDKIIAFPPCTDLALSGAKHFEKKRESGTQEKSIRFFFELWKKADCLENPKGILNGGEYIKKWFPALYKEMKLAGFPFKPNQIVNPFDFGEAAQKPTCLWLKGLPLLKSTNMGDAPLFGSTLDRGEFHVTSGGNKLPKWYNLPPSENRAKIRSKTFSGIANAMAEQWG